MERPSLLFKGQLLLIVAVIDMSEEQRGQHVVEICALAADVTPDSPQRFEGFPHASRIDEVLIVPCGLPILIVAFY